MKKVLPEKYKVAGLDFLYDPRCRFFELSSGTEKTRMWSVLRTFYCAWKKEKDTTRKNQIGKTLREFLKSTDCLDARIISAWEKFGDKSMLESGYHMQPDNYAASEFLIKFFPELVTETRHPTKGGKERVEFEYGSIKIFSIGDFDVWIDGLNFITKRKIGKTTEERFYSSLMVVIGAIRDFYEYNELPGLSTETEMTTKLFEIDQRVGDQVEKSFEEFRKNNSHKNLKIKAEFGPDIKITVRPIYKDPYPVL